MADRTGQQLGNYRLVRLLGQGGFAEVYLAEHIHLGTQAAIKLLHTHLAGGDIDFFRHEARTIARLVHPHIVRVFDFGIEGEMPFLVMDYAPNGTVRKKHPKGVALPLSTIQSYVKQIADALQYAHDEQFIHRDVKPENLLIGRRQELLLSDFGIALIAQTSRSQSMQDVAGTASYMAPEQFQGKPRPASDQYALAVMVYEWLTGTCPFHGSFTEIASQHLFVPPPPLKGRMPGISSAVEQVVMTALAKDPHHRFGSVQAFATAFEQASQVEPSQVLPTSRSLPPAETASQPAQTPTEPVMSPGESFIATELIVASTEPVTPPGQISLPPTEFAAPLNEAAVPPTELALPSQETVPDSDAARPSNGTAIKPSGSGVLRSKKPLIIGLLVLVLLFGSFGGVIYAAKTVNPATATDAINSTIAQTNAKNIAQLDPALATSTPDPYPPTNGKLTLYDPMHDNSNQGFGWQDDNNYCKFTGTAYQVKGLCGAANIELNDFAFEITVDFTQTDPSQSAQVEFRDAYPPGTWYAFSIYGNGTYDFQAVAHNLLGAWVYPISLLGIQSDAIHQGAQTNTIAIVAIGSTIDLYANGVKLNSFEDNSSNYGGMNLSSFNSANFSNAKLWTF